MLQFKNDIVKIYYYEEQNVGMAVWDGAGTDQRFKDGMNAALALIKEKKITRWIGHMDKMGVISQENQAWVNGVWFPAVIGAGLTRIAIVISKDVFGKMTIDKIMSKVMDGVYSCYFDNVEEAKKWVVSKEVEMQN